MRWKLFKIYMIKVEPIKQKLFLHIVDFEPSGWYIPSRRRKRIASKLMDVAR